MEGVTFSRKNDKQLTIFSRIIDSALCSTLSSSIETTRLKNIERILFSMCSFEDYDGIIFLLMQMPLKKVYFTLCRRVDLKRLFDVLIRVKHFHFHPAIDSPLDGVYDLVEKSDCLQTFGLLGNYSVLIPERESFRLLKAIANSKISKVNFRYNTITFVLREFANMLNNLPSLRCLVMTANNHSFEDADWGLVCEALANSHLEHLDFRENYIPQNQMITLLQSLTNNKHLKTLQLSLSIDKEVVCFLQPLLGQLKHVNLGINSYTTKCDVINLGTFVAKSQSLRSFNCFADSQLIDRPYFPIKDMFVVLFDVVKESGNLLNSFDNRKRIENKAFDKLPLIVKLPLRLCFERNEQNLASTTQVCQTLLSIKKFRTSNELQTIGQDMTKVLAKHLFLTWTDTNSWSQNKDEQNGSLIKRQKK